MAKNQIKDKLAEKLVTAPATEEDLVYVLSKIRKILELDNYPEDHSTLNFYCNLALHATITRRLPPKVLDSMQKIIKGEDYSGTMVANFIDFHVELQSFMDAYELPNFYPKSTSEEKDLLFSILLDLFSETPVKIDFSDKWELRIEKISSREGTFHFTQIKND